jgi:hypothetical protein
VLLLQVMRSDLFTKDTNWGFTSYDNIITAFLTIFQGLTIGGWRRLVWQISDCFNPVASVAYWASLMIVGNYFLVKLILAVMVRTYKQQDETNNLEDQRSQAEAVFAMVEDFVGGDAAEGYYTQYTRTTLIARSLSLYTLDKRHCRLHCTHTVLCTLYAGIL